MEILVKITLNWFQKAEKPKPSDDGSKAAAIQQGNYTDHQQSPYSLRMQVAPMSQDEMEAFEYVMDLMAKEHPEKTNQSDLIDFGIDSGWLYVDEKKGTLHVSEETP